MAIPTKMASYCCGFKIFRLCCSFTLPRQNSFLFLFSFFVPILKNKDPLQLYQQNLLRQGMMNSSIMYPQSVTHTSIPGWQNYPQVCIILYMNNILFTYRTKCLLIKPLSFTIRCLETRLKNDFEIISANSTLSVFRLCYWILYHLPSKGTKTWKLP